MSRFGMIYLNQPSLFNQPPRKLDLINHSRLKNQPGTENSRLRGGGDHLNSYNQSFINSLRQSAEEAQRCSRLAVSRFENEALAADRGFRYRLQSGRYR